jgi:curved DNA-binding protein CbpA
MKNYYLVLGLPQNATNRQIRAHFLQLARERHPDRFQGADKERAEIEFQELTQAFNLLSDPVRRRELDTHLARGAGASSEHSAQAARVYLQRGAAAYRKKSYSEALENFEKATREEPENAKTWYHLAIAGRHLPTRKSDARAAAAKACELDSMNFLYLRLAGSLFAEAELYAPAARYFRLALDWGDDDPETKKSLDEALKAASQAS